MFAGVKGNLTESEGYIFGNLIVTATTILLTVYFLLWPTYVKRADVIISSVLVAVYGADGVLALSTLARFARLIPQQRKSYADNDEPVKLNGKCLVRGMVQKVNPNPVYV
ncbi:hypothetical protein CHARACLAT_009475 [Characodon lateralis]|uniref:Uncharacterized protein n=1 Tax=Characodon lateralis TaxID=208331 RepID=A0ABU7F1K7_9TELE|nr:hypothetical protein [Characodon lateralis]